MTSTSDLIRAARTATCADCARLFATIRKDFVSQARIELIPCLNEEGQSYLQLQLIDDCLATENGEEFVHIWSSKEFSNELHLISMGQLFDLLIVGYRVMERYFEHGEAVRPTRRRK